MQLRSAAPLVLAVLVLLFAPSAGQAARGEIADPSAGWHGRAIQDPKPRPQLNRAVWPQGWSAGPVGPGSGYVRQGGSERVREVQRRLRQLGYRPGPVDGLFGPRTQAATRWFQYKHGFRPTGRVNRFTLAVLKARSQHRPLNTRPSQPQPQPTTQAPAAATPTPAPEAPAPASPPQQESGPSPWLISLGLIVLALALGLIVGLLGPRLRPRRTTPAAAALEPPTAAVRRPPTEASRTPQVIGYIAVDPDSEQADTTTAAIALRCAHRGWTLTEIINDEKSPGVRLTERPGLAYAIRNLRSGPANGLVVARLGDVMPRVSDLATLLQWLNDASAFLGAVDHELDTTTRSGQATARAVIELGTWQRRHVSRFSSGNGDTHTDLAPQLAAMLDHGISMRAIADALNLTGMPGPSGHARWQATDVKIAAKGRRHA